MSNDKEVQGIQSEESIIDDEQIDNNTIPGSEESSSTAETQEGDNYVSETDNLEKMILSTGIRV